MPKHCTSSKMPKNIAELQMTKIPPEAPTDGEYTLLENPPIATVPNRCNMGQMVAICTYSSEACSLAVVALSHSPKRLRPCIMGRSNRCGYCHQISHCVRH